MSTQPMVPVTATETLDDANSLSLIDLLTWMGEGKRTIAVVTALVAAAAVAVTLSMTLTRKISERLTVEPGKTNLMSQRPRPTAQEDVSPG